MKNYYKLNGKYAAKSPILPTSSGEEPEVIVPRTSNDMDRKWLSILEEAVGMDSLTEKPSQNEAEILESLTKSEPPEYEKDFLKELHPLASGLSDENMPTIRPGKRANLSPNTILKMCSRYYDLCCKF